MIFLPWAPGAGLDPSNLRSYPGCLKLVPHRFFRDSPATMLSRGKESVGVWKGCNGSGSWFH